MFSILRALAISPSIFILSFFHSLLSFLTSSSYFLFPPSYSFLPHTCWPHCYLLIPPSYSIFASSPNLCRHTRLSSLFPCTALPLWFHALSFLPTLILSPFLSSLLLITSFVKSLLIQLSFSFRPSHFSHLFSFLSYSILSLLIFPNLPLLFLPSFLLSALHLPLLPSIIASPLFPTSSYLISLPPSSPLFPSLLYSCQQQPQPPPLALLFFPYPFLHLTWPQKNNPGVISGHERVLLPDLTFLDLFRSWPNKNKYGFL